MGEPGRTRLSLAITTCAIAAIVVAGVVPVFVLTDTAAEWGPRLYYTALIVLLLAAWTLPPVVSAPLRRFDLYVALLAVLGFQIFLAYSQRYTIVHYALGPAHVWQRTDAWTGTAQIWSPQDRTRARPAWITTVDAQDALCIGQ